MAAFVPSGLPVLRGARAPAPMACPASRLRMAAPAVAGRATPVSRRRALELMAFAAATGGLLASPAHAADDFTTSPSGLKYKVVKKGTGPKPVEGYVVWWWPRSDAGDSLPSRAAPVVTSRCTFHW